MRTVPSPAPLAIVDVNVWLDYFAKPTAEADRKRLRVAKERGVVRMIMTAPIQQELMRTCVRDGFERYSEIARFAWNACGARVLLPREDREASELRHRRKLARREGEAFVGLDGRRQFRDERMLDEAYARSIAADVEATHAKQEVEEPEKRDATVRHLDEAVRKWRRNLLRTAEEREDFAVSWARDDMSTRAQGLGLPHDEAALPDPRTLPTFYVPALVHVTHIHGVLTKDGSPTATDLYDRAALHDAGAYAEILATSDHRLTGLAARTGLPLRVLDYEAWNDELRRLLG